MGNSVKISDGDNFQRITTEKRITETFVCITPYNETNIVLVFY